MQGRFEGVSVKEPEMKRGAGRCGAKRERGFSMVELCVVISLILVISAIAITSLKPAMQDANCDTAMRQVISQLRQAREYAITNRRYVQVTFPVVAGQPEIVITQRNDLTVGAGGLKPILSTIPIHGPESFLVFRTGGRDAVSKRR
jgi:prepilin-type N-terminal cleavage/methylation domain-containing protein